MRTKHTPGPWEQIHTRGRIFIGAATQIGNEVWLADVYKDDENEKLPADANASLITAAPDLLEALTLVRGELEAMTGYWTERMDTLAQMADAAIAKARGQA